ncbi:MAG: sodium ion-translocating decarboxylase subunit beta [Clostridiales Family XIII bacterium]|jgi:oxaloacetate decarboxylase beta subunit|nr:sodium ion-translocating decarboxylase subunit beta [Clostridiales Family XIII bacterium]
MTEILREVGSGILGLTIWQVIMFVLGGVLIFLAIKFEYEPMLLLPIGFGAILVNIPFSSALSFEGEPGFLQILYNAGIVTELFPVLIFIAVGAMIDFKPLLQNPFMLFFGAAAQFGIFFTMMFALATGQFDLKEAASIGIIGAADGPTSIFVASKFAQNYLGPISVAAYSYMSLVPLIQPPVIRALTTKKERLIRMKYNEVHIPKIIEIIFPIMITLVAGLLAPMSVALIGALMFGNLVRVCGVLERLSLSAQNELANLVTLLLGITIGSTMTAEAFLDVRILMILGMGLVAFIFDTAGGVLFAKLINLFLPRGKKVNPMIGAAGISAFPMSGRVVQRMAAKEDPNNFILMQAMSANVAGQLGSVVAGSMVLALVPIIMLG